MKHKAISILVPVVIVAVVVGLMAFVVSQDEGGAAALTVDGTSVSQVTINRELAALANTGLATTADGQPAKVSAGALSSNFTASWLTTRVAGLAIEPLLERHGLTINDADLRRAGTGLPASFATLPSSARDAYLRLSAGFVQLDGVLGEASNAALNREMRRLDVVVNAKYGRWARPRAQVCAWTGCAFSSESSGSTG